MSKIVDAHGGIVVEFIGSSSTTQRLFASDVCRIRPTPILEYSGQVVRLEGRSLDVLELKVQSLKSQAFQPPSP